MTCCIQISFDTRLSERKYPLGSERVDDSDQNSLSLICCGSAAVPAPADGWTERYHADTTATITPDSASRLRVMGLTKNCITAPALPATLAQTYANSKLKQVSAASAFSNSLVSIALVAKPSASSLRRVSGAEAATWTISPASSAFAP